MTEFSEEKRFIHTRYDEILNGHGETVFEQNVPYTAKEVNDKRFCAFRQKQSDGKEVFCCAAPLSYKGDRLCVDCFSAWKENKNKEEEQRQVRHQEWFDRECQREFDYLQKKNFQKNAQIFDVDNEMLGVLEYKNATEKEEKLWQFAEMIVSKRDKFAN